MAIRSESGMAHGWGRDPWKWVSGLSRSEREALERGETVYVTGCPTAGGRLPGVRVVIRHGNGRLYHRLPSQEQMAEINQD